MKNYILTGAPGSGKTSLIQSLKSQGFTTISEAATDVIADAQKNGISQPWRDPDFIDKIVILQKKRQLACNVDSNLVFFDRSPFCTYALTMYLGFEISPALLGELNRIQRDFIYEKEIFFIENLGFIQHTNARQISFEESLRFEQIHLDVYQQFGFNCIKVEAGSVLSRSNIIKDYVS